MNLFTSDLLNADLQKSILKLNFKNPTPIQDKTIPVVLENRDLLATAQTGTGKTAAFVIPLLHRNFEEQNRQVLVLAPTRELAAQIHNVIFELSQTGKRINTALIVGGASMQKQVKAIRRKPDLIIATPGRLMDHLNRQNLRLDKISTLVLDEADRMLDMGFGPQIEEIYKLTPKGRQVLMFSATLPPKIKKLSEKFLKKPEHIFIGSSEKPLEKIEQSFLKVENSKKRDRLLDEINSHAAKTLVFARTKRGAEKLMRYLKEFGVRVDCIHGDRSQSQRNRALHGFRSGKSQILVATDVASRGIDVDGISLVVNFDLPETRDDYIHRIGRTGRAGQSGTAISFVAEDENKQADYLQGKKGSRQPKKKGRSNQNGKRSFGRKKPFRSKSWRRPRKAA